MLGEIAVADDVASGRLIVVPPRGVDLSRNFRALSRRVVKLGPAARRLLDVAVASSVDA